jgi:hypothetical protein
MAGQHIALSPTRRAGGEPEQLAAVLRELATELAVARRECRSKHRQIEAHERGLVRLSRTVSDLRRANDALRHENARLPSPSGLGRPAAATNRLSIRSLEVPAEI